LIAVIAAVLGITTLTAQTIVTPPSNLLVTAGQSATFTVQATGPGTLTYQWRRNGWPILGGTSASFTLANTSRTDADYYDVVVSAGTASVTSPMARLTVAPTSYPTSIAPDPKWNLPLETANAEGRAIAPLSDGRVYIAGSFTSINGIRRTGIARVNADGITLDLTFTPPEIEGRVEALAVQRDGKVVIGGYFHRVNGIIRNGLARLNSDGSLDPTFAPATGVSTMILTLAVQDDGRILAGGYYIELDNTNRNYLVRLNGDGSIDTHFLNQGMDGTVRVLLLQSDGRILVGGDFANYIDVYGRSTNRPHLARLNSDGTLDTTYAAAPNFVVISVAIQADGKLIAAGGFPPYAPSPTGNIARFNIDGSIDSTFATDAGVSFDSIALQPDGKIIVGGVFPVMGVMRMLARLNSDGSRDLTYSNKNFDGGYINAFAWQANGQLLLAGNFSLNRNSSNSSMPWSNFGRLNPDGTVDSGFHLSVRGAGSIYKLLPLPEGKMLVLGQFDALPGKSSGYGLLRLNIDGSVDSTFNSAGSGINNSQWYPKIVDAIVQPDGKIVITGSFDSYNGTNAVGIARLNTDGTLDRSFNAGAGLKAGQTLIPLPGGRIFVGGQFTQVNGVPRSCVAVLNGNGALDTTFARGAGAVWSVESSIVQPDGKILIGGSFDTYDGVPVNKIARLNADGTLDTTFVTDIKPYWPIWSMAIQPDGKILASGSFLNFDGRWTSVLRLNPDGTTDRTFAPPVTTSPSSSLLLQEDGRIIVRGWFTDTDGDPTGRYLMRLNSDGTRDSTFFTGGFVGGGVVSSLVMRDDGQLAMQSEGPVCFAMTQNASAPSITSSPSDLVIATGGTAIFSVTASSVMPLDYQWLFNDVPLRGANQASLSLTNVQSAHAGNYRVVVSSELGSITSAVATLTLAKVPAVVVLNHLAQTYDGTPHPIMVTTVPTGLPVTVTYDGSTTVPTQAGTYAVTASVTDPTYEGSTVGTLTIAKATATVSVEAQTVVYNGIQKPATATTSPAGLYLRFTYNGGAVPPTNAGSYAVNASVDDPNYTGTGSGTLTITQATATLALGSLTATYDGTPKSVTAVTSPGGLTVAISYNGSPAAPSKVGSYSVTASIIDSNYIGSASGALTIAKATATVTLQGLNAIYDGSPLPVTVSTAPAGLVAHITYNGSDTPPTYPGTYAVAVTVDDSSYTGSASGTLFVTAGAMVRHAPILTGGLDGSLQMLLPEDVSLDGVSWISGDFLVPGEPTVSESGSPIYVGVREATGSATPNTHQITLNDGATLRYLVRRVDALAMLVVSAPPVPIGTRNLVIASANPNVGNVSLLRNITLIGAGQLALPGGTYGVFSTRGTSKLTLGIAGATSPTVYNLQGLTLTEHSQLILLGPVVINLASAPSIQVSAGTEVYPDWLTLNIASGDLLLTGDLVISGFIVAPTSAVTISGGAMVYGGLASDRLILDDGYLVFPSE